MSDQTWAEQQEDQILFSEGDDGAEIAELLQMAPTNRTIANAKQGILLASLRYVADYYIGLYPGKTDYASLNKLCDIVESYQLTMSGETNSRVQFIKAYIGKLMNKISGKNQTNELSGKGG